MGSWPSTEDNAETEPGLINVSADRNSTSVEEAHLNEITPDRRGPATTRQLSAGVAVRNDGETVRGVTIGAQRGA